MGSVTNAVSIPGLLRAIGLTSVIEADPLDFENAVNAVKSAADGSGVRAWWFNQHKSLGMVLGLLVLLRLAWALLRPRVPPLAQGAARQRLASGAHRLLYALMLLVPLAGFLGSVFSGYPIRFYGLLLPQWSGRWDAAKALMAGVHHWSAWALLALAVLHVAATAHHQLVLRDGALRRMR